MGQTLTHGIYLPDEGERNCYNGLAGNWQLLDGAVGTIAEHTSALAGKAPAVHTHTKSDITDFPAYGNTAGTICEGNDSRLSDARTPVAHTHTKSDVTDLLNSNFIPSATNSYDLGSSSYQWNNVYASAFHGNADTATEFASNQSVTLTGTIEGTASSKAGWTIATNFREGRGARTTTDFYAKLASGSVSGGWNVYVATFICNASERFETALVQICFVVNQQGIVDATNGVQLRIRSIHGLPKTRFVLVYKNDTNRVLFELYAYNPSANQGVLAQLLNEFIRNGNKQSVSLQTHSVVIVNALPDGYTAVNAETVLTANDFIPSSNNAYELGTSTNKWKTLNGVNPGALSLPDVSRVTNIDTTGWVFDGSTVNEIKINNAVQTLNGWLYIRLASVSNTDSVGVRYNSSGKSNMTFIAPFVPGASHMTLSCPIVAGVSANVWSTKQPEYIKFYLSLGEVNNFPS